MKFSFYFKRSYFFRLRVLKVIFTSGLFFIFSHSSYACSPNDPNSVVLLQGGTFSAGQDMVPNTILRTQQVISVGQDPNCTTPAYLSFLASGGSLYPGSNDIYQTGVSGLGARFKSLRTSQYFGTSRTSGFSGFVSGNNLGFNIEFVVMGAIDGGKVNSNLFPTLMIEATDTYGRKYIIDTYSFSGGGFDVQVPTCTTPDYTYDLGKYGLTNFSDGRQVSPWINTPITLTGCSTFYGNNSNGSYTRTNISGTNPLQLGTIASNTMSITLTPKTQVIDSTKGIVSLDATSSASGLAIQIGNNQSGNYIPLDLSKGIVITTTPGAAQSNYTIPIGARIVRSTGALDAGSVSTSLVYTVSYN